MEVGIRNEVDFMTHKLQTWKIIKRQVFYRGTSNKLAPVSGSKHTFLSGGADVLAAGTVKFNNGSIRAITNASGHYLPTPGEGMNFLR